MIEIDLARQLQAPLSPRRVPWLIWWVGGGFLLLGILGGSSWWTHLLQQQGDSLLHQKALKMEFIVPLEQKQKSMKHLLEQKNTLGSWVDRIKNQEKEKYWPIALLEGISQSAGNLEIWLERVQLESQVVELHGRSLDVQDIGKFIEALENDRIIRSLPVMEISDRLERETAGFSFIVQFVLNGKSL